MTITITDPKLYTKDEMYEFLKDCTLAINNCPNSAASYENILSGSGAAIYRNEISNIRILDFYSKNKVLNSLLGYDKYLSEKSKKMIKNYKLYKLETNCDGW